MEPRCISKYIHFKLYYIHFTLIYVWCVILQRRTPVNDGPMKNTGYACDITVFDTRLFHCLDQSFAKTKDWDQTAWLQSQLELSSTNHCSSSLLMPSVAHHWFHHISLFIFELAKKREVIFAHQNLISNLLTYLVHAKSTGELIGFGFSDRPVRSLVSANCSAKTTSLFGWSLVLVRV